jgi:hypothetical protein
VYGRKNGLRETRHFFAGFLDRRTWRRPGGRYVAGKRFSSVRQSGRMIRTVLGIDLGSAKWSSVGSATIEFDGEAHVFTRVVAGAIAWPTVPLTPGALADVIDAFARREGVRAVALDGPQGWRDPATAEGTRGVGRRCEYECRTQGKTGAYPRTYPETQRVWIEFCVDVFAKLLANPGVELADPAVAPAGALADSVI